MSQGLWSCSGTKEKSQTGGEKSDPNKIETVEQMMHGLQTGIETGEKSNHEWAKDYSLPSIKYRVECKSMPIKDILPENEKFYKCFFYCYAHMFTYENTTFTHYLKD